MRPARTALALLALCLGGMFLASPAGAADTTTWLCKPGQADNPCSGPLGGKTLPPPGKAEQPLNYQAAVKPAVDCFYVYPTQSSQAGPNANLDKDPPIRRVAVQQARQFSRVCNVYAPMYPQYVLSQIDSASPETRDVAYNGVVAAWKDYLANYNNGRPVILLGHSQGSTHLSRLIAEHIEGTKLENQIVSAIIPGTNLFVPNGKLVGGTFKDFPICTKPGEFGCVVNYNSYYSEPGTGERLGRTDSGTWLNPSGRPDSARFETVCTNPATLDGGNGVLGTLVNSNYLGGVPSNEDPAPWWGIPDFYRGDCMHSGPATWLNITKIASADDTRLDIANATKVGISLHGVDVNLAEDNLVRIAGLQVNSYMANQKLTAKLKKRLEADRKKLHAAIRRMKKSDRKCASIIFAKDPTKPGLVHRKCASLIRASHKVRKLRAKVKKDRKALAAL